MLDDALRLLVRFWDRIDGAKAVRLLPGTVEIGRLIPFLGPLLRRISEGKRNAAVVKSLRRSENLQASHCAERFETRKLGLSLTYI